MKRQHKISERGIKAGLGAMREVVAAPRDFRSKILARLAAETGQASPAATPSIWKRLFDLAARPVLVPALGAALLLGFGLWLSTRTARQEDAPGSMPVLSSVTAPGPQVAKVQPRKKAAQLQVAKAAPAPKPQDAVIIQVEGNAVSQNPAPAGNSGSSPAASSGQFKQLSLADASASGPSFGGGGSSSPSSSQGGVSAAGNPTAGAPETPTPMPKALDGNSQVRRNRFLASRGEYASILFRMKAPGKARIEAYDRNGKLVAVIHEGQHPAGVFEIRWFGHDDDGQVAPTGIYLVRVKTDDYDGRHKVVLVK